MLAQAGMSPLYEIAVAIEWSAPLGMDMMKDLD